MEGYISGEEYSLINKIADRAVMELGFNKSTAFMDITLCHEHSTRIRLGDMLKSSSLDFAHDMIGINRNLDHHSYKLNNFFAPRFAE